MRDEANPRLDGARLIAKLGTRRRIGRFLEVHEELDSTNLEAARRCETRPLYELDGLVLLAEHQTRGKGRRGDSWYSEPGGGICLTAVFQTSLAGESLSLLSVVAGVAAVLSVDQLGGPRLSLKWPNDLFIGERKVGGILMELYPARPDVPLAILGIGLNTHLPGAAFPAELQDRATSIRAEAERGAGRTPSRGDLVPVLVEKLQWGLDRAESGRLEEIGRIWRERSLLLGRRVRIRSQGRDLEGRVAELPLPPSLVLVTDDGEQHEIRGEWAHVVEVEQE